jgi:hypothetical protein
LTDQTDTFVFVVLVPKKPNGPGYKITFREKVEMGRATALKIGGRTMRPNSPLKEPEFLVTVHVYGVSDALMV